VTPCVLGSSVNDVEQITSTKLTATIDVESVSKEEEVFTVEDNHSCGKEKVIDKADDATAPSPTNI